jgi:hypothetical protein
MSLVDYMYSGRERVLMSQRDTVERTDRTAEDRPRVHRRRYLGVLGTGLALGSMGVGGAAAVGPGRGGPPEHASSGKLHPASLFVRPAGTAEQEPRAPAPSGDDLLVERRAGHPVDDGTDPDVVDGDLGQLTWERFAAVEGRIRVKCLTEGTHVSMHLRNLVPNGVYTAWTVLFGPPGFDGGTRLIGEPGGEGALGNVVGFGPLGPADGSENAFRASASGEGQVSTIQPGGPLGAAGAVEQCALEEFEWHVIVGLHLDGRTHGRLFDDPESPGSAVEQAAFVFSGGDPV